MLWVYGVGNHGGGPTCENIEAAIRSQKTAFPPQREILHRHGVLHTTRKAGHLEEYGQLRHEHDVQRGFFGVFTTHSDMKRWNRDAEATTESAEAIAAFASRYGFEYPNKEFRRNSEEITWNHHHDTLPGTSIHPSYNNSEKLFKRVMDSSGKIGNDALALLATKIKGDGNSVVVFNPCAFTSRRVRGSRRQPRKHRHGGQVDFGNPATSKWQDAVLRQIFTPAWISHL